MRGVRRVVAFLGALLLAATGLPLSLPPALAVPGPPSGALSGAVPGATSGSVPGDASPALRAALDLGSSTSYQLNGRRRRWNPCAKIHFRVNSSGAGVGALTDVMAAVARVEAATGLDFEYDGSTTVIPQQGYGRAVYSGSTPPPVVIAWARPGKGAGRSTALHGGSEIGVGMWSAESWNDETGNHPSRIVTGAVVLDVSSNRFEPGFAAGKPTRGVLLLHELGHVVGLDHVRDATQIMNSSIISRASYGSGDLAGLAKLGSQAGCIN